MLLKWLRLRDNPRAVASAQQLESKSGELSLQGRAYVQVVTAAGAAAILYSFVQIASSPPAYHWLLLAALTLFSAPFAIRIPSLGARVSASETFVFASALLFGPAAATLTVALDGLLVSIGMRKRGLYRTLFNMAEPALSVSLASQCFYLLAGVEPLFGRQVAVSQFIWPLVVLTTTYFVLNSGLIALAVAFETRTSPIRFLRSAAPHLSLNYVASLFLVVLVVQQSANLHFAAAGVIVPLLVMSYFSSKTSIARVEDANRHLAELSKLYLSMVETLATAIDAKDQVTHGHIRRVQRHTVALAHALGVKDEVQLKALEAAGLLHDVGKLAVPDYILNKPGRLTPVEFEQMSTHASVGANILATIQFPYPVAPIVRHHHEQWDGRGYPDGLCGEDIPLGARILAVVDCFDALTSDRPYRRKVTDEEALQYLKSQRGKRYDPRIVDTFAELCPTLRRELCEAALQQEIAEIVAPAPVVPLAPAIAAYDAQSAEELAADAGEFRGCLEHAAFDVIGHAVARFLRSSGDDSLCTLYRYDPSRAELAAAYVSNDDYAFIRRVRMPLGERLSGWVGANRQTIVNSDPALDLGELIERGRPRLRTCLSTALVWGDTLTGVLSLYSPNGGFSDEQTRRVEHLAPAIAEFLCRGAGSPHSATASNGRPAIGGEPRPGRSTVPADGQRHQPLISCA